MNFTFGIITSPGSDIFIQQIVDSICDENIPNYEIIIIGGNTTYNSDELKVIPFDESQKRMWITRKKNLITQNAKYENVVYLHDYITLLPGWYKGFLKFGNEFEVCMTPILNTDNTRFRDWTLWFTDPNPDRQRLLPYDVTDLSKFMYISGAYWIAKKKLMEQFPLDESLSWGDSEDVKWSMQVRENHGFKINTHSSIKLLKYKNPVFTNATPQMIQQLRKYATL
jgi:hypothetical protein